eukprot:674839-Pleurochrysis_carterae.AAC.3
MISTAPRRSSGRSARSRRRPSASRSHMYSDGQSFSSAQTLQRQRRPPSVRQRRQRTTPLEPKLTTGTSTSERASG